MLAKGKVRYVKHARERLDQRQVTYLEVEYVLQNGFNEKAKDRFDEEHNAWNYAIRGKTIDGRKLRIIASFYEDDLLVITVIDLDK